MLCQHEIRRIVYLKAAVRRHYVKYRLPEEAMLMVSEAGCPQHINRTVFEELWLPVLPARSKTLVVVDSVRFAFFIPLPYKVVKWNGTEGCIGLIGDKRFYGAVDVLGCGERRGTLEKYH